MTQNTRTQHHRPASDPGLSCLKAISRWETAAFLSNHPWLSKIPSGPAVKQRWSGIECPAG